MKVSFYQVPIILISNSSYLGKLTSLGATKEVNVNLQDLRNIDLLLPKGFDRYNYIKVEDETEKATYYYILERYKYNSGNQVRLNYKIDILRTLREINDLDLDLRLNKYSGELPFSSEDVKTYFWNNQDIKLSGDVISKHEEIYPIKEEQHEGDSILRGMQWVYIWLQPRPEQKINGKVNQYYLIKTNLEDIIHMEASELPIGITDYTYFKVPNITNPGSPTLPVKGEFTHSIFRKYPIGTLFYDELNDNYYVIRGSSNSWWDRFWTGNWYEYRWLDESPVPYEKEVYATRRMPIIKNGQVPLPLHVMVFPIETLYIRRKKFVKDEDLVWGIDEVLPHLNDPSAENNWMDFVVDIKVSQIPPFDISQFKSKREGFKPIIYSEDIFTDLPNMISRVKKYQYHDDDLFGPELDNDMYIPSLISKPSGLITMDTNFSIKDLPIDKESMLYNKYYLSVLEERIELNIPLLKHDKAYELMYYEDTAPGRNNILIGFVPEGIVESEKIRYLIHSPSTLSIDRDLSLPLFTSAYGNYLANNKNFMAQAELSRKTELTQGLITSGSQAVGALAVSASLPGYSPINAISRAAGGTINSIVAYHAQKKQFQWNLDNIKSAPGSFKSANATLITRYALDQVHPWISIYTSSDLDKQLHSQLLEEIGYDYFDYKFTLKEVLDNLFSNYHNSLALVQGRLTGRNITFRETWIMVLIYILDEKLQEGIKVYT